MPRKSKGPRLFLRSARSDRGQQATWVIRDGPREVSTGCPEGRLRGPEGAETKLAAYIADKWAPPATARRGDPADVLVADVLAFYAQKRAPKLTNPGDVRARLLALGEWWAARPCSDIKLSTCEAYVAHRTSQGIKAAKRGAALKRRVSISTARRELGDLSSALSFYAKEYPLHPKPIVTLPPEPEGPREALTRSEAARLLKAAMGWRLDPATGKWSRLQKSSRANRAHLRRFILLGFYTGSRPGVLPELLWHESPKQAWADLDTGTIYRRGAEERDHRTKRRPLVRMPPRLIAHMRRWREADFALQDAKRQAGEADFTLTAVLHHGGAPIGGRIRTGFEGCVRDAGLSPEITPHWMRHTCATWLMEAEVPLWDAAAYTGMSTKTLEDRYGHHRPSHQARARKALG